MELSKKNQPAAKTSNIHVGSDYFAVLTKVAIGVSFQTGKQIKASHVAQYLTDNYLKLVDRELICSWLDLVSKHDPKSEPPTKPTTAHVGADRYSALTKVAIAVSYETGKQIGPSQVAQCLVDQFSVLAAKQMLLAETPKESKAAEGD